MTKDKGFSSVDAVTALTIATVMIYLVLTMQGAFLHTMARTKIIRACTHALRVFESGYRTPADFSITPKPIVIDTVDCRLEVIDFNPDDMTAKVKIQSKRKDMQFVSETIQLDLRQAQ